jgi:hypothetical protein
MFNHPLHTQITLYRVPKKRTKQLNLLLSRCTMLDSLTMVNVKDLCRLLSMVAKRKRRLRHLAIYGLFDYNRHEYFTHQLVSIFTKQVLSDLMRQSVKKILIFDQCGGSGSDFFHSQFRIQTVSIQDPHQRI